MWETKQNIFGGAGKFFRLILSQESLENYYKTNFTMMNDYKYSLSDLENMIPWERDIYVSLLIQHVQKENDRLKQQQG